MAKQRPIKMDVPDWAHMVINEFADHHGFTNMPTIEWYKDRTGRAMSNGVTNYTVKTQPGQDTPDRVTRIAVTAGRSHIDQLCTLVHELCHWLDRCEHHHGPQFYRTLLIEARRIQLPLRYLVMREAGYRIQVIEQAYELGFIDRKSYHLLHGYVQARKQNSVSEHTYDHKDYIHYSVDQYPWQVLFKD